MKKEKNNIIIQSKKREEINEMINLSNAHITLLLMDQHFTEKNMTFSVCASNINIYEHKK